MSSIPRFILKLSAFALLPLPVAEAWAIDPQLEKKLETYAKQAENLEREFKAKFAASDDFMEQNALANEWEEATQKFQSSLSQALDGGRLRNSREWNSDLSHLKDPAQWNRYLDAVEWAYQPGRHEMMSELGWRSLGYLEKIVRRSRYDGTLGSSDETYRKRMTEVAERIVKQNVNRGPETTDQQLAYQIACEAWATGADKSELPEIKKFIETHPQGESGKHLLDALSRRTDTAATETLKGLLLSHDQRLAQLASDRLGVQVDYYARKDAFQYRPKKAWPAELFADALKSEFPKVRQEVLSTLRKSEFKGEHTLFKDAPEALESLMKKGLNDSDVFVQIEAFGLLNDIRERVDFKRPDLEALFVQKSRANPELLKADLGIKAFRHQQVTKNSFFLRKKPADLNAACALRLQKMLAPLLKGE